MKPLAEQVQGTAQKADWVIAKMDAMVQHLDIPTSLKPYGVTEADLPALVKGRHGCTAVAGEQPTHCHSGRR